MGAFFSPCLPAFNVLKLIGLMYLRSWAVLTCNVPHQQVFRASSNNFYLAMLLFMLFLCMLPTIFAIARYRPSEHCGPFGQEKIYDIISETVATDFPLWFSKVMSYVTSPVVVLPGLLLLMLIYYLQSIARSLKFTNNQLRLQLQTERTEDKKKVFQLAARLQAPEPAADENPDHQETDGTSKEASIHTTPSPRRNGSVTNFQSPGNRGNSIRTISQSASRTKLNRGTGSGSVRSPAVTIPKRRVEYIPNPRPFIGGPSGTCRSKSCLHMAYNSPAHCSDSNQSEPLYRKTVRPLHPAEAPGIIAAQSYGGRRGHATRYVIINEHESRKKLLRSATRIPCHYVMEEPAEILELYPRNIRRYPTRTTHHQPHSYRSHTPQHLSKEEEEGEEERDKGRRKVSLGKTHRPRSLSDLHQQAQFYIGEGRNDNHAARYRVQEDDEEDNSKGDKDWVDLDFHSPAQVNRKSAEPGRSGHHLRYPRRPSQSPSRSRHLESHVKTKLRAKLETPLTESDSASAASSSDQQNSSTDQYIQVIHN
uniref:Transmembrane channel-like protein n=1 Tax=Kryptolebias marmoratus TaxID=37003 RepID=A0A3Q3BEF4_KRYMA